MADQGGASGSGCPVSFSASCNIKLGIRCQSVSGAFLMGHCKGKDNVKKRLAKRKKTERLALAKSAAAATAK